MFGNKSSQPGQGGSIFGTTSSQPGQSGGLFGTATSQPAQGGGLLGSATSQPAFGGLLGSTTSQQAGGSILGATNSQPTTGGFLGMASSQPAQSGGLFGNATTQSALGGGLFATAKSQPAQSGGIFGSTSQPTQGLFASTSSQPAQTSGLFGSATSQPQKGGLSGASTSQPTQGLFSASQAPQGGTLFYGPNQSGAAKPAASLNLGQQAGLGASTTNARIDLEHLRPTTKFDQLTEDLQREIINLDTAILNEMNRCNEVSNLLPTIAATGSNIPNDVAYVTEKLEEVETGLENDAEDIQDLKEKMIKKDANEAKVCFREVDRLKMPSQYQASVTGPATSMSMGVYGGHGLSGWWNHPQTLQRSIRAGTGGGGSRALQLPGDEDEDLMAAGPKNLVDFFEQRTQEMRQALAEDKVLLGQIEDFVIGVESKIAAKERDVMGRDGRPGSTQDEEDQVALLRYVFGEFERTLYEVADKVGAARDGVQKLVLGAISGGGRARERLAW